MLRIYHYLLILFPFLILHLPGAASAQCPEGAWRNPTTPPPLSTWENVSYGNDRFVALAGRWSGDADARVAYTTDGMTWHQSATTIPNSGWRGLTYGNGLFVAVGWTGSRRVMTSPDGNTWTVVNSGLTNNGAWQSVAFGKGLFVAVANNGTNRVMTSANGTSWTARTAPAGDWGTIGYGGGRFVVLGFSGTTALYSSDGINWHTTSMPSGSWMDVVYGGGQFVAVSWTGTHIATSPDGVTWTARSVPDSRLWNGITYVGGHYIVVGGGGSGPNRMMVSRDGIEWIPQPIPHDGQTLSQVIWANDMLLVMGHDLLDSPQVLVGDCPRRCYMPNGKRGTREWFASAAQYKFCDGEFWRDFSLDGTAGTCSVPGQIDWHDLESAHTICDGSTRQVLRLPNSLGCYVSAISAVGYVEEIDYVWPYEHDYTYQARLVGVSGDDKKLMLLGGWNNILAVYDITDPDNPVIAGSYFDSARNRLSDAQGIAVHGNRVYIAARNDFATGTNSWVSVFDVSGGSDPVLLGQYYIGSGSRTLYDIAVSDDGRYAYTVSYRHEQSSPNPDDSKAWMHVLDVSDPGNISTVSRIELSATGYFFPNSMAVARDVVVVSFSDSSGGLATIDVSNPASPVILDDAFDSQVSGADSIDITPDAHYAFVAGRYNDAFAAYDISDPSDIRFVSRVVDPAIGLYAHVRVHGNVAVLSSYGTGSVIVIDISDPENMEIIQILSDGSDFQNPSHSAIAGDYLYIADPFIDDGTGRLTIVDLGCSPTSGGITLGPCTKTAAIDFEPAIPLYKYCDGSDWRPMTSDPCSWSSASPGTICHDGTIYAGLSPDGDVPMFITGPEFEDDTFRKWNNGNVDPLATGMGFCFSSEPSCYAGYDNTLYLAGLSDAHSPYQAANYCHNLTAYGYSDWYLPSIDEMKLIWNDGNPIGDVWEYWGYNYWSSSEADAIEAYIINFDDGEVSTDWKADPMGWGRVIRCARKRN